MVKEAVRAAGGVPFEFGVFATCGNISIGTENLKYELALLYELSDRHPEAVKIFQEIVRINPSYRDVSRKLSHLAEEDDLDILIELKEEGD